MSLPNFLKLFEDSLYFFQNDVESYTLADTYRASDITEELIKAKQAEGLSPMYTLNSFYTSKERVEANVKRMKELRGSNVKIPVTPRFKENLKSLSACYIDLDLRKEGEGGGSLLEVKNAILEKLERCPCPPQVRVSTKNGLQLLWLLKPTEPTEANVELYTDIERGLIEWGVENLGSMGDKVKDVTRYFRLPGAYHLKNPKEPYLVRYLYKDFSKYTLNKLHEMVAEYIPEKVEANYTDFQPIHFDKLDTFDLAEAVNAHVDIHEAVPLAFKAVGVGFGVASDGYRWVIDGRLTGTFYNKQGQNFVASSSAEDYYSGPTFAVIIQIFEKYATKREGAQWLNSMYGERLRMLSSKVSTIKEVKEVSAESTLGIPKSVYLEDMYKRRSEDCYSWLMPELDAKGGLITKGRMCIVGGMHGVGKSTYLAELVKHNAKNKKVCFLPLEMGREITITSLAVNLYNRKLSNYKKLPFDYDGEGYEACDWLQVGDVDEGFLYGREPKEQDLYNECVEEIYNSLEGRLYIGKNDDLSFETLVANIEAYHALGCELFVIDHLHQLAVDVDSETQFYSNVAKHLNKIAQEKNIALVCIVQLTKSANSGNEGLNLSSFKGTSEFTSNAHRVLVISKTDADMPTNKDIKMELVNKGKYRIITEVPDSAVDEYKQKLQAEHAEKYGDLRNFEFLKSRGRRGGKITVRLANGSYKIKE